MGKRKLFYSVVRHSAGDFKSPVEFLLICNEMRFQYEVTSFLCTAMAIDVRKLLSGIVNSVICGFRRVKSNSKGLKINFKTLSNNSEDLNISYSILSNDYKRLKSNSEVLSKEYLFLRGKAER